MDTSGRHLLAEYQGCDDSLLDDRVRISELLVRAARTAGATVVETCFHAFSPRGVAGVVLLEESHISIHTWPEAGYAAVDFFTCGSSDPIIAHHILREGLSAARSETFLVHRGLSGEHGCSLELAGHLHDPPYSRLDADSLENREPDSIGKKELDR